MSSADSVAAAYAESDEMDEMSLQKAMLQAQYRLADGQTQRRPQVRRIDERGDHFEQTRRQLRAEEDTVNRSNQDIYDELERDVEEEARLDARNHLDASGTDSSEDDESDEDEHDDDYGAAAAGQDPHVRNVCVLSASSAGGKIWKYGSPVLYSRIQHLLYQHAAKAIRLRRVLKPAEIIRPSSDDHAKDETVDHQPRYSDIASHCLAQDETLPTSIVQGTEVSLVQPALLSAEPSNGLTIEHITDLASTLTRIDECESLAGRSSASPQHSQEERDMESRLQSEDDYEDSSIGSGSYEEYTDEETDEEETDDDVSQERLDEAEMSRFPVISQLLATLKVRVSDAFLNWGRPLIVTPERIDEWVAHRRAEVYRCVDQIELLLVSEKYEMRVGEQCRQVYHCLYLAGFPEAPMQTLQHDLSVVRGIEIQGYSYHPRLFPTMTTLNASLNAFGLLSVLNLEHSDRRLGRPSSVPMPHPHADVNTAIILCEPRKKKNPMDDFRSLPHPKKAGIHGVEDFLVEEELQYRQCIQLHDHLNRHGTLKGLPSHLYPLVYALLDFDVEEFAKLLSSKRSFLASVPTGVMRRIADRLKKRIHRLEGSREAVRIAVGAVGFFCQGAMWRDQVLNALANASKNIGSFHSMHELSITRAPMLLPNAWVVPEEADWLEKALRLFLASSVTASTGDEVREDISGIFDVLVPILRASWRRDAGCVMHAKSQHWQRSWGPAGDVCTYICDHLILQCFQALLCVTDVLLKAKMNTVSDPLTFLEEFSRSRWRSDLGATGFLLGKEKTTNMETAGLAAMAPSIDNLRERWAAAVGQGSVNLLHRMIDAQSAERDIVMSSSRLHRAANAFNQEAPIRNGLYRVLVSTHRCSVVLNPTVVFMEVPRIDSKEVNV